MSNRRTANLNGIVFTILSVREKNRTKYTIEGPSGFVQEYWTTKDAWVDVLCAHLGVAGNAGVIDRAVANVPRSKVEHVLSECFDAGCPIHDSSA